MSARFASDAPRSFGGDPRAYSLVKVYGMRIRMPLMSGKFIRRATGIPNSMVYLLRREDADGDSDISESARVYGKSGQNKCEHRVHPPPRPTGFSCTLCGRCEAAAKHCPFICGLCTMQRQRGRNTICALHHSRLEVELYYPIFTSPTDHSTVVLSGSSPPRPIASRYLGSKWPFPRTLRSHQFDHSFQ